MIIAGAREHKNASWKQSGPRTCSAEDETEFSRPAVHGKRVVCADVATTSELTGGDELSSRAAKKLPLTYFPASTAPFLFG